MSRTLVFFIVSICIFGSVQSLNYRNCAPNGLGTISRVNASSCENLVCRLRQRHNITIEIDFIPKYNISRLDTIVYGKLGRYIPAIRFPISNPNACRNSGLQCPLQAGQIQSYKYSLLVSTSYPRISVNVIWRLNAGNYNVICIDIPSKITS